jgi:hypothetical protein
MISASLLLWSILAGGEPSPPTGAGDRLAPTHKALGKQLRKMKIDGEKVTAYSGDGCTATIETATKRWTLDWTHGRIVPKFHLWKGNRLGIPVEGEPGFLTAADGSAAESLMLIGANSPQNMAVAYVVDRIVKSCR